MNNIKVGTDTDNDYYLIPYKSYTALLTQSGTDAPVATILENTLGDTLDIFYDAAGRYSIYYNDGTKTFYNNKTVVIIGSLLEFSLSRAYVGDGGVMIHTRDFYNDQPFLDGQLSDTTLEIRVYP